MALLWIVYETSTPEFMSDDSKQTSQQPSQQTGKAAKAARNGAGGLSKFLKSRLLRRTLIMLLLIAIIAALGYLLWQQQRAIALLSDQQNALAASSTDSLNLMEETVSNLQSTLEQTRSELATQQEATQELNDLVVNTRLRLQNVDLGAQGRVWMLTEVEGMLRLAQQRLLADQDVDTAIALLLASDEILRNIDDSTVYPARDAIANDLTALRVVPDVDTQGIYLRLSAQAQRIQNLQLKTGNEEQLAAAEPVSLNEGEQIGWLDKVVAKMGALVTVRRHDAPLQGMITAEQGYYARQNIQLLLEQAQLALWREQEEIYRNNLGQALNYIRQYFLADDEEFRSIVSALESLRDETILIQVPPSNSGLVAVRQLMESYERGAAE